MVSFEEQLRRATALFGGHEPAALGGQPLRVMRAGTVYASGTALPLLGRPLVRARQSRSGLQVPLSSTKSAADYIETFLSSSEYLDVPPEVLVQFVARQFGRNDLLRALTALALSGDSGEAADALRADYLANVSSPVRERLLTAKGKVFTARQPLLMAMRAATRFSETPEVQPTLPIVRAAILLVHAHAAMVGRRFKDPATGTSADGLSELAIELVLNQLFNQTEEVASVFDRIHRLWQVNGHLAKKLLGRTAEELFLDATGLTVDEMLAMGLALITHAGAWTFERPPGYPADLRAGISEEKRNNFLSRMASTPEEIAKTEPVSEWDFLVFEQRPLILLDDELLIVDEVLLLLRLTSGMYWFVNDHVKASGGDSARKRWTEAWGTIVEATVEEQAKAIAPHVIGGTSFFTEEDLQKAFPARKGHQRKNADVVIDFGVAFMGLEVVSGRPTVETRIKGTADSLRRDIKKIVLDKAAQLEVTAQCLQEDPKRLVGSLATPRPFQPVLVAGGGFPLSPVTARLIETSVKEAGRLTGTLPLAVIELDELDMLEALHEHNYDVLGLLREWKISPLGEMSLKNFLIQKVSDEQAFRPARLLPFIDGMFEKSIDILELGPEESGADARREIEKNRDQ